LVGGGFAALERAEWLGRAGVPTTIIDRKNHHLFQPLLYQVATAALTAADIAEPVRKILRAYRCVEVVYGEVCDIDLAKREVATLDGTYLPFEHLVLANGAETSYFGHDDWQAFAPGLKCVEDARLVRSRLLLTFERAERASDPEERLRLLTVVIIGGGPTGVELAGSVAELAQYALARDFRHIEPRSTRIVLIEAGPRLIPGFSQQLSDYATDRLRRLGVEVLTGQQVTSIERSSVALNHGRIECGIVLWAAGVRPSLLAGTLGVALDPGGRVVVRRDLSVSGADNVFALGDAALFVDETHGRLPGLAQVAKQQGRHLGRALARQILRGQRIPPFEYKSRGNTAIIGRHAAVFERDSLRIKGWLAWIAWAIIHVYLLVGFQHRLTVTVQWLWRYLTYERGARLIVPEHEGSPALTDQSSGRGHPVGRPAE
jgi:NADH dehydrogenase